MLVFKISFFVVVVPHQQNVSGEETLAGVLWYSEVLFIVQGQSELIHCLKVYMCSCTW